MFHLPIGKRFAAGMAGGEDQLAHALAAAIEALEQSLERVPVAVVPLWRNPRGLLAQHALGDLFFKAIEPGLERLHPGDTLVDAVARVQPAQRRVGKIPLSGIEAESEVDHHCRITLRNITALRGTGRIRAIAGLAKKNRLPAIRVAGPLVEDQNAEEIRKIPDRSELLVGQK